MCWMLMLIKRNAAQKDLFYVWVQQSFTENALKKYFAEYLKLLNFVLLKDTYLTHTLQAALEHFSITEICSFLDKKMYLYQFGRSLIESSFFFFAAFEFQFKKFQGRAKTYSEHQEWIHFWKKHFFLCLQDLKRQILCN